MFKKKQTPGNVCIHISVFNSLTQTLRLIRTLVFLYHHHQHHHQNHHHHLPWGWSSRLKVPNGAPFPWSYWRTGGKLWVWLEIAVFVEDAHVGKVGATPEKSGWSGFLWLLVLFLPQQKVELQALVIWVPFGLFGPYRRSWKRNKVCLKTRMGIRRFEGPCWPVNGVMYWFKPVSFLAGNGEWFGIPCSTGEVKIMNLRTYNFWDKKIEGDLLW